MLYQGCDLFGPCCTSTQSFDCNLYGVVQPHSGRFLWIQWEREQLCFLCTDSSTNCRSTDNVGHLIYVTIYGTLLLRFSKLIHSLPIKVNTCTHGQAWMHTLHNYHSSDTDEHLSCHAAGLPEINPVYMQYSVLIKHLRCTALCRDCLISCRILLQNLKLSNPTSYQSSEWSFPSLPADWQSIPYDSCTESSLLHHQELVSKYQQEIKNASGSLHEIDLMPGNRIRNHPSHTGS